MFKLLSVSKVGVSILIVTSLIFSQIFFSTERAYAQAEFLTGIGSCSSTKAVSGYLQSITSSLSGVLGSLGGIASGLGSSVVPVYDETSEEQTNKIIEHGASLLNKEFVLDCLAWSLQKELTGQIADAGIDWIQSGSFGGQPFFLENPNQFYAQLQDQSTDVFLDTYFSQSTIGGPYKSTIERAVRETKGSGTRVSFEDYTEFTLSNDGAFLSDYSQGGLEEYTRFLLHPAGNIPIVGYSVTLEEDARRIALIEEEIKTAVDQGDGFIPEFDESGSIVTPGTIIEGQTQKLISSGLESLQAADEISEMIELILSALITSIFSGSNSLIDL